LIDILCFYQGFCFVAQPLSSAVIPKLQEERMHTTDKLEAESLIKKLPDESTFEDIQYHLYVAEKLKNARKQIKDRKIHSQAEVKKRLKKWIMK